MISTLCNDKLFLIVSCFCGWLTDERRLASISPGTIVRDPQHRESPTRREQNLNLCRTLVQVLMNEVVQCTLFL